MFRIKICGITTVEDALVAAEAGASAIGLNFYRESPRCIDRATARRISAELGAEVLKVGVVVNATAEVIRSLIEDVGLDLIQLHGDEPDALVAEVGSARVVLALRGSAAEPAAVGRRLEQLRGLRAEPGAILVDAHAAGQYGGTGRRLDWQSLNVDAMGLQSAPLILAGGLTAENVGQAIRQVRPWGVDTASGVESRPGVKDPRLVAEFVAAAKAAFEK